LILTDEIQHIEA